MTVYVLVLMVFSGLSIEGGDMLYFRDAVSCEFAKRQIEANAKAKKVDLQAKCVAVDRIVEPAQESGGKS